MSHRRPERTIDDVDPEPLLYRDEVAGILFVITDISANVQRIRELLEEEVDGEDSEDDA